MFISVDLFSILIFSDEFAFIALQFLFLGNTVTCLYLLINQLISYFGGVFYMCCSRESVFVS